MTARDAAAEQVLTGAAEMNDAEEMVVRRALSLLLTGLELSGDERAVATLMRKRAELYFACRRMTRAVDAVDRARQPHGWRDEDREASRP